MPQTVRNEIEKIYGIYHADGDHRGALIRLGKDYWNAHCSLCDITHKGISMKRDWKNFTNSLDVDFELLHLNEQTQGSLILRLERLLV